MMKRLIVAIIFSLAVAASGVAPAKPTGDHVVFAVVMTRHGVRSFTHAPLQYQWPDWQPVAPGFLTAHGYRLATYLGTYYRRTFASLGLPMTCADGGTYMYADLDQRTLATAHALLEGACGSPDAAPVFHDATTAAGTNDTLFDGADWLGSAIDTNASRAAVAATLPIPYASIVTQHAAEFSALQALLDARCGGTCTPVVSGDSRIAAKSGLAKLGGPVDTGSEYAGSLFLQYAQCGPELNRAQFELAMRLRVLEYDVNARNAYAPLVKGGNVFAHIVGLLQEKAGVAHPGVDVPDISRAGIAILSGHDTQLGAIGGILNAHWSPGHGIVPDDIPPGSALVFELLKSDTGTYSVRTKFVYQTLDQYRSASALANGEGMTAVTFPGCTNDGCTVPLARFGALAQSLIAKGFVQRTWTPSSDAPIPLAPLRDPSWTKCKP